MTRYPDDILPSRPTQIIADAYWYSQRIVLSHKIGDACIKSPALKKRACAVNEEFLFAASLWASYFTNNRGGRVTFTISVIAAGNGSLSAGICKQVGSWKEEE